MFAHFISLKSDYWLLSNFYSISKFNYTNLKEDIEGGESRILSFLRITMYIDKTIKNGNNMASMCWVLLLTIGTMVV